MIFKLTDKEQQSAEDWIAEHKKTCPHTYKKNNLPTLGEHYYYKFIPNGLGNLVSIGCIYCEESKDITDTENW